jgi:hypothetical protein
MYTQSKHIVFREVYLWLRSLRFKLFEKLRTEIVIFIVAKQNLLISALRACSLKVFRKLDHTILRNEYVIRPVFICIYIKIA